jgi:Cu/Ag efflux protein CusF
VGLRDRPSKVLSFKKKSRDLQTKISARYLPLALLKISRLIEVGGDTVKNIITVLVIAFTSLAFSGLSFAQAKPVTPANPSAPSATEKKTEMKSEKAQATILTGKVTSVDAKAGKLTVKTTDKEVNMTTDSKTTKAALEKLKVGDTAKVFERGGTVIAASPVKAESKTKAAK